MDSPTIFAALRDALADLYPREEDARIVAHDAGLDEKRISFSSRAQTNWHNILAEVIRVNRLDALWQAIPDTYRTNDALADAYDQYQIFVKQGGVIDPLEQLSSSASIHVAGNVSTESGDFISRDKNIYGDFISGDKVVIQQAPQRRIPLQRPPRAQHFQDRREELTQLLTDLQPGVVVTLCGPGGIGKTSLAAEAVWTLAPDDAPPAQFPDGIIFHSFYNQGAAALALEAIARTFGEEVKPSPAEAARRALAGRRVLLLLDGTEEADDLPAVWLFVTAAASW